MENLIDKYIIIYCGQRGRQRERDRERETETERDRERQSEFKGRK